MNWDQADEIGKVRARQITEARAEWISSIQPLDLVVFQGSEIAVVEGVDDASSIYSWATIRRSNGTSCVTGDSVTIGYSLVRCPVLELRAAPKGAVFAVVPRISDDIKSLATMISHKLPKAKSVPDVDMVRVAVDVNDRSLNKITETAAILRAQGLVVWDEKLFSGEKSTTLSMKVKRI